ncbi:MAG: hypothetical protein GEV09_19420 [Pseudonocardiaceae bacterium]|nr:hypothetical protein [Pseudonocardiaceae bacterium]
MDTSTAPATPTGPRVTLWVLRTVSVLLLLAVLAQPVLAGLYLSGEWDALGLHSGNAVLVESLSFFLLLAALAYWLAGRGRGRVALAATLLFIAAVMQSGFGYARQLGLHIPLGVAVVTASVVFTVWVCRAGARTPRRPWWGSVRTGGAR